MANKLTLLPTLTLILSLCLPGNAFAITGDFSVHSDNINPSEWGQGVYEDRVFLRRLEHSQPGNNWTIKIGQGGQLYSIKTPQTGEMIARQAIDGQWVDDVFMHVISFPPEAEFNKYNTLVDGDIHQAGYYTHSDLLDRPKITSQSQYSPLFRFIHNPSDNSVSYITWPQHAHLPRRQKNNQVFMHQTVQDLGDGLLKINVDYTNWGTQTYNSTQIWSGFRTDTLPKFVISKPNGTYEDKTGNFGQYPHIRLRDNSTGGWMAIAQGTNENDIGVGLIYGKTLQPNEGRPSYLGWGIGRTGPDSTHIMTTNRHINLLPGEMVRVTYFIVVGPLSKIKHYGNLYHDQVSISRPPIAESNSSLIAICTSSPIPLRRGCNSGQTPSFSLYDNFVQGSRPLFLMQDTSTGKYMVSSDPYKIDFPEIPYGKTKYVEFLGWAYPQNLASASSRTYKSLKNILTDRILFPATGDDSSLTVPTSSNTSTKPGDLNNDSKVNIADFNKLLSGYGTTYNLSHFNQFLANFGK